MRTLLLLTLSSILLFASVGKITSIKGEVYIDRENKQISARSGSVLELKDKIITKDASKALLLFNDKTSITVGKNSTLAVQKYVFDLNTPTNNKASFGFGNGIFRTITGKVGKLNPKGFTIKTSSATIGIRGTIFQVKVTPTNLIVAVESGTTWVLPEGKKIPTDVPEGKVLTYDDTSGKLEVISQEKFEAKKEAEQKANTNEEEENKQDPINRDDIGGLSQDEEETFDSDMEFSQEEPNQQKPQPNIQGKVDTVDDAVDDAEDETENTNTIPTLNVGTKSFNMNQNTYHTFSYLVSDKEDNTDNLSIALSANNGYTTTANGTIVYIPTTNFVGSDTITVTVTDSSGGTITQTINVVIIENTTPTNFEDILTSATLTNFAKDIVGSDNYDSVNDVYLDSDIYEYGYYLNDAGKKIITYNFGELTPNIVMDSYFNSYQTASYSGGIAAFVTDIDGNTISSDGSINLNMNFDYGITNLNGSISVTEGNWQASINSGTVTNTGFSSSDITTATSSYPYNEPLGDVANITGTITDGKFYGSDADAIGGKFNLTGDAGSVSGSFGATK